MVWCCVEVGILKTETKNLQATGGTLRHHGRNPSEGSVRSVGPNLGYPEFCTGGTLLKVPLEPKKHTVHRFDRRDDFQMFRKFLKMKIYNISD